MQSPWFLAIPATVVINLVGCYGPEPFQPGRLGRDLDRPPRYGEANRYVDPMPPPGPPMEPDVRHMEPRGFDPGRDPSVSVDPGLTISPPGTSTTTTTTTTEITPSGGSSLPPPSPTPPAPTPPPAAGSVPYARAVPGKP